MPDSEDIGAYGSPKEEAELMHRNRESCSIKVVQGHHLMPMYNGNRKLVYDFPLVIM